MNVVDNVNITHVTSWKGHFEWNGCWAMVQGLGYVAISHLALHSTLCLGVVCICKRLSSSKDVFGQEDTYALAVWPSVHAQLL